MCAMRVLCCLDGTNIEQISRTVSTILKTDTALGLLYVIDNAPHEELDRRRERFLRHTGPLARRREQMQQADESTAQDILDEGGRYLPGSEPLRRTGRPEREIVNCAAEWAAELLVICSRAQYDQRPEIGPKSVGHVARFVLDHAPCAVLLVRPPYVNNFPIPR
jgi:nucleotide-binding universal stress UspA family protein